MAFETSSFRYDNDFQKYLQKNGLQNFFVNFDGDFNRASEAISLQKGPWFFCLWDVWEEKND